MKYFISAIRFLTIFPFGNTAFPAIDKHVGKSSAFFPLVGLLQGFLLLLVYFLFNPIFTVDIVAILTILSLVIINGGLHLDGLSDTFDALASRKSKAKMLSIMKDSSAGPTGVVSIVFIILIKYILLKNIFSFGDTIVCTALILSPLISRWSMVPVLFHGTCAANKGLGKTFMEHTGALELGIATVQVIIICTALSWIIGQWTMMIKATAIIIVIYVFSILMSNFLSKKFGGLTGDNVGAITEINEVLTLLMLQAIF